MGKKREPLAFRQSSQGQFQRALDALLVGTGLDIVEEWTDGKLHFRRVNIGGCHSNSPFLAWKKSKYSRTFSSSVHLRTGTPFVSKS